MAEEFLKNAFENDIANIARLVEEKRESVEREVGIVSEHEKGVIRAALTQGTPESGTPQTASSQPQQKPQKSYLDDLTPADQEMVRGLLSLVQEKGINKALEAAQEKSPYLLDVFHDELTDKLYTILKERGHIT